MMARWINYFFCCVFIVAFMGGVTGCHRLPSFVEDPTLQNLSGVERKLLGEIEQSGIQVIRQGMVFTFIIPTDCFFTHDTHELKRHRPKDIDRLALFLQYYMNYFQTSRVTITAHTDKVWLAPARDRLSTRYAEVIADYFRQDNVSADRIFVSGEGAKNPVASNGYPMAASFNRRIVVVVD